MSVIKTLLEPSEDDDQDDWEPIRKEKKEKIVHPCPVCGATETREVLDHTPSLAYAWIYCSNCNKLLYQGQNPAITQACEVRDRKIILIMDAFELTQWEANFLNNRLYERFATVKQRECLDRIAVKYLGTPFDWSAYKNAPKLEREKCM